MLKSLVRIADYAFQGFVLAPVIIPLVLVGFGGGAMWWNSSATLIEHRPELVQAVRAACEKAVHSLPHPMIAEQAVLVVPFQNDPHRLVTKELSDALKADGSFHVVTPYFADRWLDSLTGAFEVSRRGVADSEQACRMGRSAQAAAVISGTVQQTRVPDSGMIPDSGYAEFSLQLRETTTGRLLFEQTFDNGIDNMGQLISSVPQSLGVLQSTGYFFAVTGFSFLWPLALMPLIRRVLRREHNALNAGLLCLIVAVPVTLALPWVFGVTAGNWRLLLILPILAITTLWSAFIMNQAAASTSY